MYFEGAARDPINFGNLLHDPRVGGDRIKTVVLVDILASLDRHLLRPPRSLWDAYGLSIMAPVVAKAKKELTRFHNSLWEGGDPRFEFLRLTFEKDISPELGAHLTEWSYSNLSSMFKIGYARGQQFWREHGHTLPKRGHTLQTSGS